MQTYFSILMRKPIKYEFHTSIFFHGSLYLVARRATYVVDGRFFVTFFGRWMGAVRIHVSHVQLTYTVINVQVGGRGAILNFGKLKNFRKLQNFLKVVGSISGHIGSHEWQPS